MNFEFKLLYILLCLITSMLIFSAAMVVKAKGVLWFHKSRCTVKAQRRFCIMVLGKELLTQCQFRSGINRLIGLAGRRGVSHWCSGG
jgi:hypothetical protein